MKPSLMVLSVSIYFASSISVSSADKKPSWPKKGDTVFISFSLPGVVQNQTPLLSSTIFGALAGPGVDSLAAASRPALPLDRLLCDNTAYCWYFDPPCEPLKVYKSKPAKPLLMAYDPFNSPVILLSDFTPWLHRTREECAAAVPGTTKPSLRYREHGLWVVTAEESPRPDSATVSVGGPLKPAGLVEVDAVPPEPPVLKNAPAVPQAEKAPASDQQAPPE